MKIKPKHIIWDWNGTLLDDVDASITTINFLLKTRGMDQIERIRYRDIFGFPVKNSYQALGFDVSVKNWPAIAKEFQEIYAIESLSSPLRCGVVELLQDWMDKGLIMSILSASKESILQRMVEEKNITKYFTSIKGIANIFGDTKLEVGLKLINDSGIRAQDTLLIGDTLHDAEVAKALGCNCVLLADGHQSLTRLHASGWPIVFNLSDLNEHL